ncbi:MAG: hypothetical protein HGA44_01705 [Cellulomonadaceae bacterium]|nr:hypothetical protein [Cellulomonadaceae bacterium]
MSYEAEQVLDTSHIQQLLELRSQLGDATRWATQAGPLQLTTAVVLLDGVVERALYIAAAFRGANPDAKKQFDGLHGIVRDVLGEAWTPPAWGHVLNLHRARNGAQHAGLAPNSDALVHWTNAVEAFTRWLVETAVGVDLGRVVLTDAVQDRELRQALELASAALAKGDAVESVTSSLGSVDMAELRWSEALGNPSRMLKNPFAPQRRVQTGASDAAFVQAELEDLRRQVRLGTFAQDPSEVAWFARLRVEKLHVNIDDADRALAFATSWILGFESAMSGWTHDRRARAERLARRVRQGAGPAYLGDARAAPSPRGVIATLTIFDVPDEEYDAWRVTAETLWRELRGANSPRVGIRGDGTVTIEAGEVGELQADIRHLGRALALADERLASDRSRDARHQIALREARDRFAQQLADRGPLPSWVSAVELDPERERGAAARVVVADNFRWLTESSGSALRLLQVLAARSGLSLSDPDPWPDGFDVFAPLEPDLIVTALWAMNPAIQKIANEGIQSERWLADETVKVSGAVQAVVEELKPRGRGARPD